MNDFIENIYQTQTVAGVSGIEHKLESSIDPKEGEFLSGIINEDKAIKKTLEVGCAYGLSSLHICLSLKGRKGAGHTILDPSQNTHWDGVGVANLRKAGIDFFELLEEKSEFALPRLLQEHEGTFDFIFIDGWHTFDHTLLDCFYATRLLRVGGYLAIDDVSWNSVRRVVNYLSRYPCYTMHGRIAGPVPVSWKKLIARAILSPISGNKWERILAPQLFQRIFAKDVVRMAALKKTAEDQRKWDWHSDLF